MFVTAEEKELARKSFWPFRAKSRVVPYGIIDVKGDPESQVDVFRAAFPQIADRRFILFLSRIHPKKGCDILVEAFAKVAAMDPALDLVIAGPDLVGSVKHLRDVAARARRRRTHPLAGNAQRRSEMGRVPLRGSLHTRRPIRKISKYSRPEALACSKPVLTTNKVATWREVEEYSAGFIRMTILAA